MRTCPGWGQRHWGRGLQAPCAITGPLGRSHPTKQTEFFFNNPAYDDQVPNRQVLLAVNRGDSDGSAGDDLVEGYKLWGVISCKLEHWMSNQ